MVPLWQTVELLLDSSRHQACMRSMSSAFAAASRIACVRGRAKGAAQTRAHRDFRISTP
jgi:hypothetical protein